MEVFKFQPVTPGAETPACSDVKREIATEDLHRLYYVPQRCVPPGTSECDLIWNKDLC